MSINRMNESFQVENFYFLVSWSVLNEEKAVGGFFFNKKELNELICFLWILFENIIWTSLMYTE